MSWATYPRTKYSNVPKRYAGRTYHSTLEANYAAHLDLLIKAGEIQSYTPQPLFRLEVNGKLICKSIPDFLVIGKHGREEIHEVKGRETDSFQIKWKLLQALRPEYHYKLIKKGDF